MRGKLDGKFLDFLLHAGAIFPKFPLKKSIGIDYIGALVHIADDALGWRNPRIGSGRHPLSVCALLRMKPDVIWIP